MKNIYVHVEVLDKSMNAEYIIAIPAHLTSVAGVCFIGNAWYTTLSIENMMMVPGAFIVRKRQFENERIS